jgi:hypothetical protein
MFTSYSSNWLYNGSMRTTVADLGYFMGYTICKSYYNNSTDKKKAIKDIIELDFKNEDDIERFLSNSKYYPEPIE